MIHSHTPSGRRICKDCRGTPLSVAGRLSLKRKTHQGGHSQCGGELAVLMRWSVISFARIWPWHWLPTIAGDTNTMEFISLSVQISSKFIMQMKSFPFWGHFRCLPKISVFLCLFFTCWSGLLLSSLEGFIRVEYPSSWDGSQYEEKHVSVLEEFEEMYLCTYLITAIFYSC